MVTALDQRNIAKDQDEWLTDPVTGSVMGMKARTSQGLNFLPVSFLCSPSTDSITAFAGGGQSSATALLPGFNRVGTVATAGDSVALPDAYPGSYCVVINNGANPLQVFGTTPDTINGVATATGVSVPPNSIAQFFCVTDAAWVAGVGTGYSGNYKTVTYASALTAFATGGQTSATLLTGMINRISVCATALDSVKLPPNAPGMIIEVTNNGAITAAVFPDTGAAINNLGTNIATPLPAGWTAVFYCNVANTWAMTPVPPRELNTNITTVGAGTLTAAGLVGGVITRTGPTAAYTDTTDTAANLIAALHGATIGQSWNVTIKNTVAFTCTLAGGTGVTLSGQGVIPPNSAGNFLLTYSAASAFTLQGISVTYLTTPPLEVLTALSTVGAGTITAAGIVGGVTNRTGSTSAFTDTTDTAANIIAAMPNSNIGQSFEYSYYNNTPGNATITGGTGVTLSNVTIVPANMWATFLVTYTAAGTITMAGFNMGQNAALPATQFVTISAGNGTLAAGNMEGANVCNLASSGATAMTTRTAAQLLAQIPNGQVGMTYDLYIFNSNGGTLTLTGGTGVTITGTATIATNIVRKYVVTITGAATATMQNMGSFTAN